MEELKTFMAQATTVAEWNELREEAKMNYSHEQINLLDASGYISEVLKNNKLAA